MSPVFHKIFPLRTTPIAYRNYQWSEEKFDQEKDWALTYKIFTTAGKRGVKIGHFKISRKVNSSNQNLLKVQYYRDHQFNSSTTLNAMILTKSDTLWSPTKWEVKSSSKNDNQHLELTDFHQKGIQQGEEIKISINGQSYKRDLKPGFTFDYCLLGALTQFNKNVSETKFDLLENFNIEKPDQKIGHWKSMELQDGTEAANPLNFNIYTLSGYGSIPYFYFQEPNGRIPIITTGIEYFILEEGKNNVAKNRYKQYKQARFYPRWSSRNGNTTNGNECTKCPCSSKFQTTEFSLHHL